MRRARLAAWAAIGAVAAAAGAALVWGGVYNIAANAAHTQPVHTLLETTMHHSVRRRAAGQPVPPLGDAQQVPRGAACYFAKCVQCHGGPGVAQNDIGRSMQPLPGPLVDAAARWKPAELYWITRNGIKMSGMPAWQHHMADDDIWAVVALMQRLPGYTAAEFRALGAAPLRCDRTEGPQPPPRTPDPERGRLALSQHACSACHKIPGVTGSDVHVGPPLEGIAGRGLIAGAVPNTREQMVRWIRDPQSIDPLTAMPDLDVGEADAQDIAAYLATLR